MAALPGRQRRANNAPTVLLQARVDPDVREKAHRAAKALGLSFSAYVELLVAHEQLDDDGIPVWWTGPVPREQEELPLNRSA